MSILDALFQRRSTERELKKHDRIIESINSLEERIKEFSDVDLLKRSEELKHQVRSVGPDEQAVVLDQLLPEAFALVREASQRTLGLRHYDVQLKGGVIAHQGKIVEMKTGEGKTLMATMPAYLNGLTGRGVHLVTVNDYLARRDTVWMGQIYHFLGLSVSCLTQDQAYIYDPSFVKEKNRESADEERDDTGSYQVVHEFLRPVARKEAYGADITYGTNNVFGFDYLRDNLAHSREQLAQRDYYFAIIDEIDSILIDESRTPLIISSPDAASSDLYMKFAQIAPRLKENEDYNVDEKQRAVSLTEQGIDSAEKLIGVKNLYSGTNLQLVYHLEQALRAKALFARDKQYVVKEDKVVIVDEFTGRLMPDRRFSEGLHQALEAKEGVTIKEESRTLATITFQNLFRKYPKLAGMTGTAATSREEFGSVYGLDVIELPTHRPLVRIDQPDFMYATQAGKYKALIEEIRARNEKGQPVLIGTVSIEKNELLAGLLQKEKIPHDLLNAKNHEREGAIIAQAGRKGAVTIATNMAGRGVDIKLGGPDATEQERDEVRALGGLYVIGTERHEARRIDNQLRGRSGRQGDPGETRFFISMEDDVMRVFGQDRAKNLLQRLGLPEDQPIENKIITGAIERAQTAIEGHNFDIRKYVLRYDEVLNKQREAIYRIRRGVLFEIDDAPEKIRERVIEYIEEEVAGIVALHTPGEDLKHWEIEEIGETIKAQINLTAALTDELRAIASGSDSTDSKRDFLITKISEIALAHYQQREKALGEKRARMLEKLIILSNIDMLWTMHLDHMQRVREAVRLRAYGQKDPLVEYKREGNTAFKQLLMEVRTNVVSSVFKIQVADKEVESFDEKKPELVMNGPVKTGKQTNPFIQENVRTDGTTLKQTPSEPDPKYAGVGRNDPCPCGSGKKYKKCHGK